MLLTDSEADAHKVRKRSTQSREGAPWYQHEELGYNYRMSNLIAGVVRGQLPYLEETEILEALATFDAEGRPVWKLRPVCRMNPFITRDGDGRGRSNAHIRETAAPDAGADIFNRGLCLPSDNKMTEEQQDVIVRLIHQCFA